MKYANDFAPLDGKLKVYSLAHPKRIQKSDAFVIICGKEVYLIDGGATTSTHTLKFLLSVRKKWLSKNKKKIVDPNRKLRINPIVSHFHGDHMEALIETIISCPYIEFGNVYVPDIAIGPEHFNKTSNNGDVIYRPPFMELISHYQPNCKLHVLPYSKDAVISQDHDMGNGKQVKIDIMPFPFNPSLDEYIDYIHEIYPSVDPRFEGHVNTYITNAASMWVKIVYQGKSFLFTGDSTKKDPAATWESADIMLDTYKELITDITVMKYYHHGQARDPGAPSVIAIDPEYVIMTTQVKATAEKAIRKIDPNTKINFVNSAFESAAFMVSEDGELSLERF